MIGTVPQGSDVCAHFAALEEATWISAVGTLEGVEFALPGPGVDEEVREAIPGRVVLVSLSGPSSGPLFGCFARLGPSGRELVAGRLVKGRSLGVWFATGVTRPGATGEARAEVSEGEKPRAAGSGVTAPGSTAPPGWAALAAQSAAQQDDEVDELPKYGDRVDHFVFGLCDVMVVRGDRLKIRDVKGPGRLREIALGAVRVLAPTELEGKRVFKLAKRS